MREEAPASLGACGFPLCLLALPIFTTRELSQTVQIFPYDPTVPPVAYSISQLIKYNQNTKNITFYLILLVKQSKSLAEK